MKKITYRFRSGVVTVSEYHKLAEESYKRISEKYKSHAGAKAPYLNKRKRLI